MNAYKLFKLCMGCSGKPYLKDEEYFNSSSHFNFFNFLVKYFKHTLKFNNIKIMQYITVCANIFGNNFDPWKLNSEEYLLEFANWYKINASTDTYLAHIKDCIKKVIKFCKNKRIKTFEDYIKNWGVTHYISKDLHDNVAYVLGLHKLSLTKPEKFMIRKFLKNIPMIKERLEREGKLKSMINSELEQGKKMLFWNSSEV